MPTTPTTRSRSSRLVVAFSRICRTTPPLVTSGNSKFAVSSPAKALVNTSWTRSLYSSVMYSSTRRLPATSSSAKPVKRAAHWFHTSTRPSRSMPKMGAFAVSMRRLLSRSWMPRATLLREVGGDGAAWRARNRSTLSETSAGSANDAPASHTRNDVSASALVRISLEPVRKAWTMSRDAWPWPSSVKVVLSASVGLLWASLNESETRAAPSPNNSKARARREARVVRARLRGCEAWEAIALLRRSCYRAQSWTAGMRNRWQARYAVRSALSPFSCRGGSHASRLAKVPPAEAYGFLVEVASMFRDA